MRACISRKSARHFLPPLTHQFAFACLPHDDADSYFLPSPTIQSRIMLHSLRASRLDSATTRSGHININAIIIISLCVSLGLGTLSLATVTRFGRRPGDGTRSPGFALARPIPTTPPATACVCCRSVRVPLAWAPLCRVVSCLSPVRSLACAYLGHSATTCR